MEGEASGDVTGLLRAWRSGDHEALERLVPLVDAELRRMAKRYLQKQTPQPALETTSLLDEAYVRLMDAKRLTCEDRVVELRFFGGRSIEEIAGVLKISPDSVKRDWRLAKLRLARELSRAPRNES